MTPPGVVQSSGHARIIRKKTLTIPETFQWFIHSGKICSETSRVLSSKDPDTTKRSLSSWNSPLSRRNKYYLWCHKNEYIFMCSDKAREGQGARQGFTFPRARFHLDKLPSHLGILTWAPCSPQGVWIITSRLPEVKDKIVSVLLCFLFPPFFFFFFLSF